MKAAGLLHVYSFEHNLCLTFLSFTVPTTGNLPTRCFRRQKLKSLQKEQPSFVSLLPAEQLQQSVDDVVVTTSTPVISVLLGRCPQSRKNHVEPCKVRVTLLIDVAHTSSLLYAADEVKRMRSSFSSSKCQWK